MFAAYQIIASVTWSLELTFPEPYNSVQLFLSNIMDFSLAGILPIQCLVGFRYHTHILIVTLCPLAVILPLTAAYWRSPNPRYLQAALMVSFLTLPTSCTALFRTFHCRSFDDGSAYLFADYSVDCNSEIHQSFKIYSGVMFAVFPIGTPLVYFILLFSARDRLNPQAVDSELAAIRLRSDDSTLIHIRPMYAIYRPSMWWFEIVDITRRIVM